MCKIFSTFFLSYKNLHVLKIILFISFSLIYNFRIFANKFAKIQCTRHKKRMNSFVLLSFFRIFAIELAKILELGIKNK